MDNGELSLPGEISSPVFGAILVVCLLGAAVFMINVITNQDVVDIEVQYGSGISTWGFLLITFLVAILTAHMAYVPYVLDRMAGSYTIFAALAYYIVAQIFWSLALFHSRLNRGLAILAAVFLLAATVWLGWCCYHYNKGSIYIVVLLLLWALYLQDYTYNVDAHPWIPVPWTPVI